MAVRTHVILDGLQDPLLARDLSQRWMNAGFENAVDIAGQAAWLRLGDDAESNMILAAGIARAFGVELRERVGVTFRADNDLPALREQITREYRGRFAQSLVFGLPAIIIHYLGPMLASGGGQSASNMAFPWIIEFALVGWLLWVAGLPVLWQGVMAAIHLRATADLLVTAIVLAAFIPSAVGVGSLLFTDQPWFGVPLGDDGKPIALTGPAFHIAVMAVMIVTFQRWQLHRHAERLSGRANLMMPRFGRLVIVWLAVVVAVIAFTGWQAGLCFGLLLPPMLSAGAVNRRSPGWTFALPVIAFAPIALLGPGSLKGAAGMQFEIAAGFAWMMSLVMVMGWRKMMPPAA